MDDPITKPSESESVHKRDGKGRFQPGTKGGPGNPHADAVSKFRKEMFAAVKTGDVKEIVRSLVEQAKAGSVKHQTLFFDVMGLRIKQVEISTPEDSAIKTYLSVDIDKV